MHHGYLAVDFFFMLSGFVVGHAYDSRWPKMTVIDFFKIRLIRLHPMVLLSLVIGAIGFWVDPYTNTNNETSLLKLLGITLLGFTLLPFPDVRGWNESHSLNGPLWSLLQEYIANILYVLTRRAGNAVLWIIIIAGAFALMYAGESVGHLATGWSYKTLWIAPIRMIFPFFAGLLLYRSGKRIVIPGAFPLCSLALLVVFCLPTTPHNGLYDAACIILVFPFIVAAGAGGGVEGRWAKLSEFSGAISYPIYITHYPFIYIYTMWVAMEKPSPGYILFVASGLLVFFIVLAYASLKLYDEPVRAWLKRR